MSYEKMMAAGAEAAGGQVYINRVALAYFGNEGFTLTQEGERWLAEQEVEAKPAKAPKAAKKEAAPAAPAAEPAADLLADLDKL